MKYEYGFIGCGNMGKAIVRAVAKQIDGAKLAVCDKNKEKCEALSLECKVTVTDSEDIAANSRYIVLGVKPQMMAETLAEIRGVLQGRSGFVLVTMAAGVSMETLCSFAGAACPVIRIMPNTPASVGEGVVLCCCNEKVDRRDMDGFKYAMQKSGIIDEIPEKLIDAGSSVSGCGPAFVCLMIEAMADAGVACGLGRDKALRYAAQTFRGTAALLMESGKHPGVLKDEVCSPGGTTIEGVRKLEEGGLRAAVMNAVMAAYEKNSKLLKK